MLMLEGRDGCRRGNLQSQDICLRLGFTHRWARLGATFFRSAPVSSRDRWLFSSPLSVGVNQRVPASLGCSLVVRYDAGLVKRSLIPPLLSRSRHWSSRGNNQRTKT